MELKGILLSARPLGTENIRRLEDKYAELFNCDVVLEEQIDEGLVGGFKVKIGDRIWDESINATLSDISETIRSLILDRPETQKDGFGIQLKEIPTAAPGQRYHAACGSVISVGDGIASVRGMSSCRYSELIDFGNGCYGIAMNLMGDHVECILMGDENLVRENQPVHGTGKVLEIPVGESLLGRVVDPLGKPLDMRGNIRTAETRPIEAQAPSILDRQPVSRPLETGWLAIDAMVPIGRGQRELIIGDRQTGKTAIAVDTILNQKGQDVICIYVAIGQKASTVAQLYHRFRDAGAMDYTVIVNATASDSVPMQYIAPYAGCAIGEYFMYQGRDVLIVYDDLSKHAVAYRAISLLLKRPPGREAYPGDVFYLHSRLLERSACLSEKQGGGTMTALPMVETQSGDISAYIPTNVISITDGQIFLQSDLFHSGVRPAVSVGLSVSRVGGAAQTKAIRRFSGQLRLELAQYREMEVFARFGSDLDQDTQRLLERGRQFVELLKQDQHTPMAMCDQAILLYLFVTHLMAGLPPADVTPFKAAFLGWVHLIHPEIPQAITQAQDISPETEQALTNALQEFFNDSEFRAKFSTGGHVL